MKFAFYKDSLTSITENHNNQLFKINCLLADLARSYHGKDALRIFCQVHSSHRLKPDQYTLAAALTACANLRNTTTGNQLHAHAIRTGFKTFPHITNTLLCLYAKSENLVSVKRVFSEIENLDVYSWTTFLSACSKLGEVGYACRILDKVPQRSVAVWNAIITGCAENGHQGIALDLFQRMHQLGVRHDNYTYACVLSFCLPKLFYFGKLVHALVMKTAFLGRTSVINALVTMYFNCGSVANAYLVFEETEGEVHDQITYNVMIAGLASAAREEEALVMFKDMQEVPLRPTELTFVSVMGLCSTGRVAIQVHAQAIKIGFEGYTSVSNAAITMYSGCGDLHAVHVVFERLEEKDIVSWNAMITSYAQGNIGGAAFLVFVQLQREGIEPDEFTIGSLLASCELLVNVEMVRAVVVKSGLINKTEVPNALVSAFSRHGNMTRARQIFDDMYDKNLISWNTIISGYQSNGFPVQSLEQFSELVMSGLRPNVYTLCIVLSICASISAFRQGKQIHAYIFRFGYLEETSLGNAVLAFYAKCGVLKLSLRVFNLIIDKDIVSWNSLISAYAQHGNGKEAVDCFDRMKESGRVEPDNITFTAALSACSRAGLVFDGIRIFNSMVNNYHFEPTADHFSCIVDLLGRAGHLDAAERLVHSEHIGSDASLLWTLLSSCAAHGNLTLGKVIAKFLLKIEPVDPLVYVLLANMHANAGQWEEAANVRETMRSCGFVKEPAYSQIRS